MSASDAEILEIFRDEANERLDSSVEVILALEDGRAPADAVDRLFRDAHSIKGAAGMLGLEPVRELAHALEDVLAAIRDNGDFPIALTGLFLETTDALRAQAKGDAPPAAELVGRLTTACAELRGTNGAGPKISPPAPAPEPEPEPVARAVPDQKTIRVPAEKLDHLLELVGETVLHRRRLEHALGGAAVERDERLTDELGLGDRLVAELQHAAIEARTLPLATITGPYPRAVRDAATHEGKEVDLVLGGTDIELDRVILEGLSEPLVHVLRNAVAHGIEPPAEREAAGKSARGRIELVAEQRGRVVAVTVGDDGRGVSAELLEQARRDGSLADVLTRAGFSTQATVTDLAGRGVGLDAVKAHVEGLGGGLEIESTPGAGLTVTLLLPLTLALLEVLLVERGSSVFGVPLASVEEVVSVTETLTLAGRGALALRGQSIPLADLAELVGGEAPPPPPEPPALVVASSGIRIAAACDRLVGKEEVVVKSLGPLLGSVSGYLGAAILGDGRIALLLDPNALVRASRRARRAERAPSAAAAPLSPKLLVVEDSLSVRELQRSILEAAGYRVETAKNGRDALERLAKDGEISLVVTDVEMPELDGLGLTQAIRSQPERSSLPVIVVTSQASDDDRRRGIEAGADAYMIKSEYDQQTLLDTVGRLVGG